MILNIEPAPAIAGACYFKVQAGFKKPLQEENS